MSQRNLELVAGNPVLGFEMAGALLLELELDAHGGEIRFMLLEFRRPDQESLAGQEYVEPENFEDVEPSIIVTSFMLSELKTAFLIGFQVYLPFLILDIVIASVTISMGMLMLPPVMVSLPFKLLLFVLVDGWRLVVGTLMASFAPFT